MYQLVRSLMAFCLCLLGLQVYAYVCTDDTVPPEISGTPQSLNVTCESDYISGLQSWLQDPGGVTVTDNLNQGYLQSTVSFDSASTFIDTALVYCVNDTMLNVGFFAIDSCGNHSVDTLYAQFSITDSKRPTVTQGPQDVTINCDDQFDTNLEAWLVTHGGAIAEDCSPIDWPNYTWQDSEGNSGFGIIGEPHTVTKSRTSCDWFVRVSLFVVDACGNRSATIGTVFTTDTLPPTLEPVPDDITILCNQLDFVDTPTVTDNCQYFPDYAPNITSTQAQDSTLCEHYNYSLQRNWDVVDACGNPFNYTQTIAVVDTVAPTATYQVEIDVSCTDDISAYADFITINDNCNSPVSVTFVDSTLMTTSCFETIKRTYTVSDVCGNVVTYDQQIRLIDNTPPVVTSNPIPLSIPCDTSVAYQTLLDDWLAANANAQISDDCSMVDGFIAEIGSFDLNDPMTFPGQPVDISALAECGIIENGIVNFKEVAIVFADACDNVTQVISQITIVDNTPPEIITCTPPLQLAPDQESCTVSVTLPVPVASDNCTSDVETLTYSKTQSVQSDVPGNEEMLVNPLLFTFDQINPNIGSGDIGLTISLNNVDCDDIQEYFMIDIEGVNFGKTPNTDEECGSTEIIFNAIDSSLFYDWLNDGQIDLTLTPKSVPGSGTLGVNDICEDASIEISWTIPQLQSRMLGLTYQVDGQTSLDATTKDSIDLVLDEGLHRIIWTVTDCGANTSTCQTIVNVFDDIPPVITCPSDKTLYLLDDECSVNFTLDGNIVYEDNCVSAGLVSVMNPQFGNGELSFQYDPETESFNASDKQYTFEITNAANRILDNPQLSLDFLLNLESQAVEILDEAGNVLMQLDTSNYASCEPQSVTIDIDLNTFLAWLIDDKIEILAKIRGVTPCGVIVEGYDISRLKFTLSYSDVLPDYTISGDTMLTGMIEDLTTPPTHSLEVGQYTVEYSVQDITGNIGRCTYQVAVIDTIKPQIVCRDTFVSIPLDGKPYSDFSEELLLVSYSDNCGVESVTYEPMSLSCAQFNQTVVIASTVTDAYANAAVCESNVQILKQSVTPTFNVGICQGDTLQLFANIPEGNDRSVLNFAWSGPAGFTSTAENPIIPSPDDNYSGTYSLEVSGLDGCVTTGTVQVAISQFADPEISTFASEHCVGDEVTLTATAYSGEVTYQWYEGTFPTGILLAETDGPSTTVSPSIGEHSYYVIASTQGCVSNASEILTVTTSNQPNATVAQPFISVCTGESFQLEANALDGVVVDYLWSGPNGYAAQGLLPELITNATEEDAGTYNLQVSNNGCLSSSVTVQVIVFDIPPTPILNGDNIICAGSNLTLSVVNVTNAQRYVWYKDEAIFSTTTSNTLSIPNVSGTLEGDWQCVIAIDDCESDISETFPIVVESALQLGVTNSGPVCLGDTIQLNATFVPGANYTWTTPLGNTLNGQTPKAIAEGGEYTLEVMTDAGCILEESTLVTINEAPTITALSNTAPSCEDETTALMFTPSIFPEGNYQYIWSGPNDFTADERNPIIENATAADNGTYTLIVSNNGCNSQPVSTEVDITSIPFKPTIIEVKNTCIGEVLVLTANVPAGNETVFTWFTPNGTFETETNTYASGNLDTSNSGLYSVQVSQASCDSEISESVLVEIQLQPESPIIDAPDFVCSGEEVILQIENIEAGNIYTWITPSDDTITTNQLIIDDAAFDDIGDYTVQASNNGCISDEVATFSLFVRSAPPAPQLTYQDTTVCQSIANAVTYCFNPQGFFNYDSVQVVDRATDQILYSGSDICVDLDLAYANGETVFLSLRGYRQTCVSEYSDVFQINFEEVSQAIVSFENDNLALCDVAFGEIQIIGAADVDSISWQTTTNLVTIQRQGEVLTLSDVRVDEFLVYLSAFTDKCGLVSVDTLSVETHQNPIAQDDTFEAEEPNDYVVDILQNDTYATDVNVNIVTVPEYIDYSLDANELTLTTGYGYVGQDSLRYEICDTDCPELCDEAVLYISTGDATKCSVSNLVTPNGDGQNDYLVIPCLSSGDYENYILYIFNRYGDEVYRSRDYTNDWDARFDGKELPGATYFYIIEFEEDKESQTGFIVVQR